MLSHLRPSLVFLGIFTLVLGLIYPLGITAFGALAFPHQASGSLLQINGRVVGSELLGQSFQSPDYFWSRPSATSDFPYNALASGGSNWSPSHPALAQRVQEREKALRALSPVATDPVPVDLVTSSASGLDPHISPNAALFQIPRIARARNLSESQLRALVQTHTQSPTLGILGESRVNVLQLNLALDALQPLHD